MNKADDLRHSFFEIYDSFDEELKKLIDFLKEHFGVESDDELHQS